MRDSSGWAHAVEALSEGHGGGGQCEPGRPSVPPPAPPVPGAPRPPGYASAHSRELFFMQQTAYLWLFFVLVFGVVILPSLDMAFVLAGSLTVGRKAGLSFWAEG